MLERPEDYILQRCQELPAEAFVPPTTAAQLLENKLSLVVISYPWLSAHHPDPSGFHFRIIRRYLAKHNARTRVWDPDKSLQWSGSYKGHDFGVFWDFAALPQKGPDGKRSAKEQETFTRGLGAMALLYGSRNTVVLLQTAMPEVPPSLSTNLRPYRERGWCLFEATVSNILKPGHCRFDLGSEAARQVLATEGSTWSEFRGVATAKRDPLLHPETMRAKLEETAFTNGKEDREIVAQKYEEFFHQAVATDRLLNYNNVSNGPGWQNEEIYELCKSLMSFARGERLWLRNHNFDDKGLRAVLKHLPKLKHLKGLNVCGCANISGTGFEALADYQMPALQSLSLGSTNIDDAGLSTLARHMECFPELRVLRLSGCVSIGAPGLKALAGKLPAGLEELYLGQSAIDDKGLEWLADRLPVLQQLRRFDLRGCERIGGPGLAALVRCLPRLPRMASAQESGQCPAGHKVDTTIDLDLMFGFAACCRCRDLRPEGDIWHACRSCRYVTCSTCLQGSLWLPRRLQCSPEGEALAKLWVSHGREAQQLRWC